VQRGSTLLTENEYVRRDADDLNKLVLGSTENGGSESEGPDCTVWKTKDHLKRLHDLKVLFESVSIKVSTFLLHLIQRQHYAGTGQSNLT